MAKWKSKKDKQRYTKHTYKTKDRVTRTPLKTGGELKCSGRVGSSCSTCVVVGCRRVNLVTNPAISREWEKDLGSLQVEHIRGHLFITEEIQKFGKVPNALNYNFFFKSDWLIDKLMDVEHGINNILAQYFHNEKELTKK